MFDPCITERGQAAVDMFEKIGNAWVAKLEACVAVEGVFSSSTDLADHIVPLKRHSAKHVMTLSTDTHNTDTDNTPSRQQSAARSSKVLGGSIIHL